MIKTLTFAVLHFTVAFSVAYALTGSFAISSTVALLEPIVNTIAFYFHEKAWQKIEAKRRLQQQQSSAADNSDIKTPANTLCCGHHGLCAVAAGEGVSK